MKKFLALAFLATCSANAGWPFHTVKKAVPLTAEEMAKQAEDMKRDLRIKALKAEILKNHPDWQSQFDFFEKHWANDPRRLEDCFDSFHNAAIEGADEDQIEKLIKRPTTMEPVEKAKKLLGELESLLDQEKKSPYAAENKDSIRMSEWEINNLRPRIDDAAKEVAEEVKNQENYERLGAENHAQAVAGFSDRMKLSAVERAAIYATNNGFAYYDWFQGISPEGQKAEQVRVDKAQKLLEESEKRREQEEDDYLAKITAEDNKKAVEEIKRINASERSEQAARASQLEQENRDFFNNMAADRRADEIKSAIDDAAYRANRSQSGTIYFNNGTTATYEGN